MEGKQVKKISAKEKLYLSWQRSDKTWRQFWEEIQGKEPHWMTTTQYGGEWLENKLNEAIMKSLYYTLDENKNPVPAEQHKQITRVGDDTVKIDGEDVRISTIFLGLDHAGDGPPVLFETMIFGGVHDEYQERYCTWSEAEQGHKKAIELVFKDSPQ